MDMREVEVSETEASEAEVIETDTPEAPERWIPESAPVRRLAL